jgi:uncharacterized Tic20 family protein
MNSIQWSVLFHLSGFVGLLFPGIGNWLAPLILWLIKKNEDPALDLVGKQVLNFQFSYTLYSVALGIVAGVLMLVFIGFLLLPVLFVLFVMWIVFMIIAAIKTSNGEAYKYPFTIEFLK